ncbi:hypothetical protein TNCV_4515881 [Trichonephila clavipes]|nr:hypothetical protein TNCV_4515881 [Trichonephila clavipes]
MGAVQCSGNDITGTLFNWRSHCFRIGDNMSSYQISKGGEPIIGMIETGSLSWRIARHRRESGHPIQINSRENHPIIRHPRRTPTVSLSAIHIQAAIYPRASVSVSTIERSLLEESCYRGAHYVYYHRHALTVNLFGVISRSEGMDSKQKKSSLLQRRIQI